MNSNREKNTEGLRVIRTARSLSAINRAAREGFRPLVKRREPSDEIQEIYSVWQHPETGEVAMAYDMRENGPDGYEPVLSWDSYYPQAFHLPFAAYLLPSDLVAGEHVFLADIIEDIVSARWNQGANYRLKSCEAIWNGTDFEIDFDPEMDAAIYVG